MDKDSIRRLMDRIDDPGLKDTMDRVSDNLDRIKRAKDQRLHPKEKEVRFRSVADGLSQDMRAKALEASKGVALVLTGGGAKGSFQAGVCKVLKSLEEGLPGSGLAITGLAGTSAGALNAALYAGGSAGDLEEMWAGILEEGMQGREGFFSDSEDNDRYLEDLIRTNDAVDRIGMDSLLTVVTAFDHNTGYPRDFVLNDMTREEKVRCLLASSAFPLALKEREVRGVKYIDGGIPLLGSNMPVAPLYCLGFRRFLVVHCASLKEAGEWADLDRFSVRINREAYYNGASFVHIYSSADLGGLFEGTVNFNHEYIMKGLDQGSRDMLAAQGDLALFSEEVGPLDEIHRISGKCYRSFGDFLDTL